MVDATVLRSGWGSPFDLWDSRHWVRILNFSGTIGSKGSDGGDTGLVDGLIGLGGTAGADADAVGWRDEGGIKDGADAFNKVLGVTWDDGSKVVGVTFGGGDVDGGGKWVRSTPDELWVGNVDAVMFPQVVGLGVLPEGVLGVRVIVVCEEFANDVSMLAL